MSEYKQSISYPELKLNENCEVILTLINGEEVNVPLIYKHSYSINGPVIYYRYKGKTKSLSARSIFFETWVKGAKITKADSYEPINGDHDNLSIDNFLGRKNVKREKIKKVETRSTWMNGDNEVYLW